MKALALAALAFLSLSTSGCRSTSCADFAEGDHGKLESAARAFEAGCNSKNWDAVAALYAEDAVLMPPNMPDVQGKQAIREFFVAFPPVSDMRLDCKEIKGCGDMAYVAGTYSMTVHPPGSPAVKESGSFLEVHRRQADGSWPIVRDMFHANQPAK